MNLLKNYIFEETAESTVVNTILLIVAGIVVVGVVIWFIWGLVETGTDEGDNAINNWKDAIKGPVGS